MRDGCLIMVAAIYLGAWTAQVRAEDAPHGASAAVQKQAADHSAGDGHGESPEGGHDAHGPNYGLLTVDGMTALWTIVVFVVLLIILRAAAWKPIQRTLQNRERFIMDSLANAKREREESDRLLAQYREKLNQARAEATAIVDEGRRDAEEVKKRITAEAKVEAESIVNRARRDIEIARNDAVKQLHDQAIALATTVAAKIVRKELKASDHERLLDEALAELENVNG